MADPEDKYPTKDSKRGAREMAPLLKAHVALAEDPGSILSTHMADHKHLQLQF